MRWRPRRGQMRLVHSVLVWSALQQTCAAFALRGTPVQLRVAQPAMQPAVRMDGVAGRSTMALLGAAGALETGFIAADKLWGDGALQGLCASGAGCQDVLNSPWASVGGVPLALLGCAAYVGIAAVAAVPLLPGGARDVADGDDGASWDSSVLAVGSGAMASFSACLMLLLGFVIQQPCFLCYTSAALSAALLLTAWRAPVVPDRTESAVLVGSGALVGLLAAAAIFFAQGGASPEGLPLAAGRPPAVRAHSSPRALQLGKRLSERGARYYGAYWCSHCADQKETLGAEAMRLVPYLECAPDGLNSRREECVDAGVKGYPTWEVDGQLFPGERDLDEIEKMLLDAAANKAAPGAKGAATAPASR